MDPNIPSAPGAAFHAAKRRALIAELQAEIEHASIYYTNVELERLRDVMIAAVRRRPLASQDVR